MDSSKVPARETVISAPRKTQFPSTAMESTNMTVKPVSPMRAKSSASLPIRNNGLQDSAVPKQQEGPSRQVAAAALYRNTNGKNRPNESSTRQLPHNQAAKNATRPLQNGPILSTSRQGPHALTVHVPTQSQVQNACVSNGGGMVSSNRTGELDEAVGAAAKSPTLGTITFNGSFEDECKSMLLKLLFSFHQASTPDEVVHALNSLFAWIKTQTYNPSPTSKPESLPSPPKSLISLPLLRHAKNEFIQCAQIKQRRQPNVWTTAVSQTYTTILQHLLLSIQSQTQLQNQAQRLQQQQVQLQKQQQATPGPALQHQLQRELIQQQIQQRMQQNISQAHAQFSRLQQHRQPSSPMKSAPPALQKNATMPIDVKSRQVAKPITASPRPKDCLLSPSGGALPVPSPALTLTLPSQDFYVDMTLRTAKTVPNGDDDQLYLPQRNISKVMRTALPNDSKIKIDDGAKELMQECVTEFILYLVSESRDQSVVHTRNKASLTGQDAIKAMYNLGFTTYGDLLTIYNEKITAVQREVSKSKSEKRMAKKGLMQPPITPQTPSQPQTPVAIQPQTTPQTSIPSPALPLLQPAPPAALVMPHPPETM
ncbi:hypothetical protein AC1031_003934 [Aphanomyces cochlioides]|nr:hypothetical protein AC1031_003934 [Aphanomyces cochlioides]